MGNDDFTQPALQAAVGHGAGFRGRRRVLVLLVGLFVTTLYGRRNPAWTPITAVLALLVAGLLARDVRRRHVGR